MSVFQQYYAKYQGSFPGFMKFHNEVINMPRDQFSNTGLDKVRILAGYLLLTENHLDSRGVSYKDTMLCIRNRLKAGAYPAKRDKGLEWKYFTFDSIDAQYETQGRMFRHLMALCAFFGFVRSLSKQRKAFNYAKCREYYLSNDDILMPIARNNIMMLNVKENDFIKSLNGITIDGNTDYRPTYGILRYLKEIGRPATDFELSVLLGRVDDCKREEEILARALAVGAVLPATKAAQMRVWFKGMHWEGNGRLFSYAASQEPHFKFHNYLLFLESFELIQYHSLTETYTLTEYAEELLADDISYLIADLEKLLKIVDDYDSDNSELNDLILYQRNPELLKLAKEDADFIVKMNQRSMNNPIYDKKGKKQRNKLIAELAKIQADYQCQYAKRHIFKMVSGKYYCEAHHILEFSTEDGPDITNNLVVLGPEAHKIIHHGCREEVDNVFIQLIKNGVLPLERFREMITVYHCLTKEHIQILFHRKIITADERDELEGLLS
ncbi:MAG: hypothetical protein NC419_00840 [Muribaculaceae bacterium]|nr:hypothetical protein [Muribaculaceae bacterium]